MYAASQTLWNATVTYAAVYFALFIQHSSSIMAVGGVLLLIARLTHELPRAYRTLRGRNHRTGEPHDD